MITWYLALAKCSYREIQAATLLERYNDRVRPLRESLHVFDEKAF